MWWLFDLIPKRHTSHDCVLCSSTTLTSLTVDFVNNCEVPCDAQGLGKADGVQLSFTQNRSSFIISNTYSSIIITGTATTKKDFLGKKLNFWKFFFFSPIIVATLTMLHQPQINCCQIMEKLSWTHCCQSLTSPSLSQQAGKEAKTRQTHSKLKLVCFVQLTGMTHLQYQSPHVLCSYINYILQTLVV